MTGQSDIPSFAIWGADNVVYGPVEMPTLVEWIQDERVEADTWIFQVHEDKWEKASKISDFAMFFHKRGAAGGGNKEFTPLVQGVKPGMLRRVKILSDFDDQQLGAFVQYMEVQQVQQFVEIVRTGQHGDAMFLILEGEVRVRLMIGNKEKILTTLSAGEFFGEMTLFDQSPRSADIVANSDCVLIKVDVAHMEKLMEDAPAIATKFLSGICRTFSSRIRADNKRFKDTINFQKGFGQ